jgi:hypothetical protein
VTFENGLNVVESVVRAWAIYVSGCLMRSLRIPLSSYAGGWNSAPAPSQADIRNTVFSAYRSSRKVNVISLEFQPNFDVLQDFNRTSQN